MQGTAPIYKRDEISGKKGFGVDYNPAVTKTTSNFYTVDGSFDALTQYKQVQVGERRSAIGMGTEEHEMFLDDFIMEDFKLEDQNNVYKWTAVNNVKAVATDPSLAAGEHGSTIELNTISGEVRALKYRSFYLYHKDAITQGEMGAEMHNAYMTEMAKQAIRSKAQVLRSVLIANSTIINANGGTYASMTSADTANIQDILDYVRLLRGTHRITTAQTLMYVPAGTIEEFYENGYIQEQMSTGRTTRFGEFFDSKEQIRTLEVRGVMLKESTMGLNIAKGETIPYLTNDNVNDTVDTAVCIGVVIPSETDIIKPVINAENPNFTSTVSKGFGSALGGDLFNEFASEAYEWSFGPQVTDTKMVISYRFAASFESYGTFSIADKLNRVQWMDDLLRGAKCTIVVDTTDLVNKVSAIAPITKEDGSPLDSAAFETQVRMQLVPTDTAGLTESQIAEKAQYISMNKTGIYRFTEVAAGEYTLKVVRLVTDVLSNGKETWIDISVAPVDVTVVDAGAATP